MQHLIIFALLSVFTICCNDQQITEGNTVKNSTQIKIVLGDSIITATLYDSPSTRDFISMLPLDLELEDYAGTEKISYLPRKLSTDEAPKGYDPSVGDITYYAPWGNLAIFYKDYSYAAGLIHLGKIDNNINKLNAQASFHVRIELIK